VVVLLQRGALGEVAQLVVLQAVCALARVTQLRLERPQRLRLRRHLRVAAS